MTVERDRAADPQIEANVADRGNNADRAGDSCTEPPRVVRHKNVQADDQRHG